MVAIALLTLQENPLNSSLRLLESITRINAMQELIIGYAVDDKTLETIAVVYVSKCANGSLVYVLRRNNKTMFPMSDIRFRNIGSLTRHINRICREKSLDSFRYIMAG